jgi:hypothetical protein
MTYGDAWVLLWAAIYFMPLGVAVARGRRLRWWALANLLLGWQPSAWIAMLMLAARRTRIAKLESESALQQELRETRALLRHVTRNNAVVIAKGDLRIIRACLHPDRAPTEALRPQYEAASKAFAALKIEAM